MKKINTCILVLVSLLTMASCAPKAGTHKNLVVYYSQTGSTQMVADLLATSLNADMLCLQCETPYPDTFEATIEESRDEVKNNTGRALTNGTIADLNLVDTVFIGFPIWYGTFAPPIVTLAKENNLFAGKTVVLFCTYGSGGRRGAEADFRQLCLEANVLGSYGIAGRRVNDAAAEEVEAFVSRIREGREEMVGAFGEWRDLGEQDLVVFNKATEAYAYLNLTPTKVRSQVVAGINYIFLCESEGPDGQRTTSEVRIFAPLPGRGDPQVLSVER